MQRFRLSGRQITTFAALLFLLLIHIPPHTLIIAQQASPFLTPQPDGTLRRIRVPVLMYHYVSPLPPQADDVRIGLTVSPETFRTHLLYLQAEGYTTISLYDLHTALLTGEPLPPKPIVLTFDDGHIDHYVTVFPLLREFGFTGTFFIITGRADAGDPAYVSWAQIAEMAAAGMSMEAHTKRHMDLRQRDYNFLVYEILGSIESLQAHTGQPTTMFAYPAGRYDDATLAVLESLNVWRAVTTEPGTAHTTDNRLQVPRLRITGEMSAAGLAGLLNSNR
ncbi:MAG: polysaccharide deacetylase family protein [bacterium]|nr:polysaccharide deacetylase family protein [bacterium]